MNKVKPAFKNNNVLSLFEIMWNHFLNKLLYATISIVGEKNPFVVAPSYHHWAPWIGPQTRCSAHVLNTEFEKLHTPKLESTEADDQLITEERLVDEVLNLKVSLMWNNLTKYVSFMLHKT